MLYLITQAGISNTPRTTKELIISFVQRTVPRYHVEHKTKQDNVWSFHKYLGLGKVSEL